MKQSLKSNLKLRLFGTEPGEGRSVYLDHLRVTATVFVILVHTVSLASSMTEKGSAAFYVLELFNYIFLSCNLLFIMISGALLLPVQGEKAGAFFRKRFSRVALPLVIYYILYVCAKEGLVWLHPGHWLLLGRRILTGPPVEAPHFWLIYVIVWLYVLTPVLRWIVRNIPESVLKGLVLVIFLVNAAETYAPVFGMDAHLSPVVDSFAGVFLFGYFLSGSLSKRMEQLIFLGGVVSFFISLALILNTEQYGDYIFQNAPTMMLFSGMIFLLVKRLSSGRKREPLFTRMVSRYSFSILLIHWGVLHFVVKQLLGVNVLGGGIIGGCILMAGLTFVISLAGAVCVDNLLIQPVQAGFRRLFSLAGKRCIREKSLHSPAEEEN